MKTNLFFDEHINDNNENLSFSLEELHYRIDKIEFENFRVFQNKQVISFRTNSKIQDNDTALEIKEWKTSKICKYPRVIGLYGKNASGKTAAIEILKNYIFLLNLCLSENNIKQIFSPFDFYDSSKPINFSILINTSKFDIEHQFSFSLDSLNVENNDFIIINEAIKIINSSSERIIFKNEYRASHKESSFISKEQRKNFLTNDFYFELENNAFLEKNVDEKNFDDKYSRIYKQINRLYLGDNLNKNYIYKVLKIVRSTIDFVEAGSYRDFKTIYNFAVLPFEKKHGKNNTFEVLSKAAHAIDSNVKKFVIKKNPNFVKKNDNFSETGRLRDNENHLFVQLQNGVEIPFERLSQGTLDFVLFVSKMIAESLRVHETGLHKYLIIDEIGNNWHPQLTKIYVELFNDAIIDDTTLCFTSHDPNLADNLRSDSIFIIDNNHQIKRLSNTLTIEGKKLRNSEKFSNKYLEFAFSHFNTNPNINAFGKFLDGYEEFWR